MGRRAIDLPSISSTDNDGFKTIVPNGYNVLWLQVRADLPTVLKFKYYQTTDVIGVFSCGFKSYRTYNPDGTSATSNIRFVEWCPIPIPRPGTIVISGVEARTMYILGIGYGENLWNHAVSSYYVYTGTFNNINTNGIIVDTDE